MPTTTNDDFLAILKGIDRRLHLLELFAHAQQRRGVAMPAKEKRPRGRPRGSRNVPRVPLGSALFDENRLNPQELVTLGLVGSWVGLSIKHRQAPELWRVVDDPGQWVKPAYVGAHDTKARSWANLVSLRQYAEAVNELGALREVLRYAERLPVNDPQALRRGIALVGEILGPSLLTRVA